MNSHFVVNIVMVIKNDKIKVAAPFFYYYYYYLQLLHFILEARILFLNGCLNELKKNNKYERNAHQNVSEVYYSNNTVITGVTLMNAVIQLIHCFSTLALNSINLVPPAVCPSVQSRRTTDF